MIWAQLFRHAFFFLFIEPESGTESTRNDELRDRVSAFGWHAAFERPTSSPFRRIELNTHSFGNKPTAWAAALYKIVDNGWWWNGGHYSLDKSSRCLTRQSRPEQLTNKSLLNWSSARFIHLTKFDKSNSV